MKKRVYIHTNNKQRIGAKLAKYAIERYLTDKEIEVKILNVDELAPFKNFAGVEYLRAGKLIKYDPNDLQSFTLSRFMPPEQNEYQGRALVIDPDIFAQKDISPFFNMDLQGHALAACKKKDGYDTSVMLMDCEKLTNWSMEKILDNLKNKSVDYTDQMTLKQQLKEFPDSILEIPRIYNHLDELNEDTVLVHTTNRITQPWSTGLPIDFTRNDPGKFFGLIPKLPILKLLGKWPSTYQPHPNKKIEQMFIQLLKDALSAQVLTREEIQTEIDNSRMRKDIFSLVA